MLEDLDMMGHNINLKGNKSSPKSAHHAMGLEAYGIEESDQKAEDYGDTEEDQRKGLWRSIFGYFRGPKKGF